MFLIIKLRTGNVLSVVHDKSALFCKLLYVVVADELILLEVEKLFLWGVAT